MPDRAPARVGVYRVVEKLGEGGMGVVYRARDERLGRDVAVKVMKRELAVDQHRLERFNEEARAMAAVNHPSIVAIYDVGTWDGRPFIVTELLDGEPLRKRIRLGAVTVDSAIDFAVQIAKGVEAAHERGVLHRDLKTENLFVSSDGQIKILDFGIATLVEPVVEKGRDPRRRSADREDTQPGDVVGTPSCMAPEQIRGLPVDGRADIFAIGVVLFEMLCGRRPFQGGTPGETMAMILNDDPPPFGRRVPESLRVIVSRCLEKRPEDRFSSAHDLALALDAVRGRGVPAWSVRSLLPWGATSGAGAFARSWRRVGLLAAAVVAIGAVTVFGYRLIEMTLKPRLSSTVLKPNRVAVVPFVCSGTCGTVEPLGMLAAVRLVTALGELSEVEAVRTEKMSEYPITASPEVGRIAAATNAGLVLSGSWSRRGDLVEISAALEDAERGRVVRNFGPVTSTEERAEEGLSVLGHQVLMAVQEHLHPSLGFASGDRWPRYEAYREFRRSLEAAKSAPLDAAFEHVDHALQLDPAFAQARLVWAGGITLARPEVVGSGLWSTHLPRLLAVDHGDLSESQEQILNGILFRIDGNWLGAAQLFQEVLDRDPRSCQTRVYVIDSAMRANRPRQAIDAFEDLVWDPVMPAQGMEIAVAGAATAYHLLGRHDQELQALDRLDPVPIRENARLWLLRHRVGALAAAGRLEQMELTIQDVLVQPAKDPFKRAEVMTLAAAELREHGHREAATRLAERALDELNQVESNERSGVGFAQCCLDTMYLAGRAADAYSMVLEPAHEWPDSFEKARAIGLAAARVGDSNAAREHAFTLSHPDIPPTFGAADYVRARIAALVGDRDEAMRLLRRAIIKGFSDYLSLHSCPDFESLHDDPEFRRLLEPRG